MILVICGLVAIMGGYDISEGGYDISEGGGYDISEGRCDIGEGEYDTSEGGYDIKEGEYDINVVVYSIRSESGIMLQWKAVLLFRVKALLRYKFSTPANSCHLFSFFIYHVQSPLRLRSCSCPRRYSCSGFIFVIRINITINVSSCCLGACTPTICRAQ